MVLRTHIMTFPCDLCGERAACSVPVPFLHPDKDSQTWEQRSIALCVACFPDTVQFLLAVQKPLCETCTTINDEEYLCDKCTSAGPLIVCDGSREDLANAVASAMWDFPFRPPPACPRHK